MRLPDFKTEQWMTEHEQGVLYNLTDTCVPDLAFKELTAMDRGQLLDDVHLDYGAITGDNRLKDEILSMYRTGNRDNVTMDHGCLHADETVMQAILEPGDQVVTFTPGYQQFSDYPRSLGCKVTEIPLIEEHGWQPDLVAFREAMRAKVKMIILNNPSNPTGTLFEGEVLNLILTLAKEQGTYILVDEVYRDYRKEESLTDLYERAIAAGSLSKMFGLAGLRLGWIKGPADIIHEINVRRDYSIISTGPLADTLGLIALQNKDELLDRGNKVIEENKEVVREYLKKDHRLHLVMPKAGTVSFLKYDCEMDSMKLAQRLQDQYSVFFVPGGCFDCEKHLRLSFTHEKGTMEQGLQLLTKFMDEIEHE